MTPDQVKAIQESFTKVAPISEQAAALFYGRLFEIAPALAAAWGTAYGVLSEFMINEAYGRSAAAE
jgi:hypothetical protein